MFIGKTEDLSFTAGSAVLADPTDRLHVCQCTVQLFRNVLTRSFSYRRQIDTFLITREFPMSGGVLVNSRSCANDLYSSGEQNVAISLLCAL